MLYSKSQKAGEIYTISGVMGCYEYKADMHLQILSTFQSKDLKRRRASSIPGSHETDTNEAGSTEVNPAKINSHETDSDETGTAPSVKDSIEDSAEEDKDVGVVVNVYDTTNF